MNISMSSHEAINEEIMAKEKIKKVINAQKRLFEYNSEKYYATIRKVLSVEHQAQCYYFKAEVEIFADGTSILFDTGDAVGQISDDFSSLSQFDVCSNKQRELTDSPLVFTII